MIKNPLLTLKIIYKQRFISVLLMMFFNIITFAQQVPHYTQYSNNMQVLNPAFVGAKSDISISLLTRQQWVGVEGSPKTHTFSISGRTISGLGFGTTVINDKIGLAESTNINIDASYTILTSDDSRISFGLKGGMTFFTNNLSNGITPDNDVYASTSGNFPNIGFGALYYNEKFFLGMSIPNLLKSTQFKTLENLNENGGVNNSNYFLAAGTTFDLSDNFKFRPSTIIKYTPSLPVSIDLNTNFIYNDKIETGLSYRYQNSITDLFALNINEKWRIGYSYDYQLASFGSNLSSHEIIVLFDIDLNRSTRWLPSEKCFF